MQVSGRKARNIYLQQVLSNALGYIIAKDITQHSLTDKTLFAWLKQI